MRNNLIVKKSKRINGNATATDVRGSAAHEVLAQSIVD